jgi:hypothetical protein
LALSSPRWFVTLLALLIPLGFLIALRLLTSDDLDGVSFDPEPLVTTPTEREVRDQQRVNVALAWEEGAVVRAPGWSGVVTAVYVAPGETPVQGQRLVAVDGVDRVAFASASPFYRALESGDEGPDVALLHELLLAMGLIDAVPADPAFLSFATSLAVEEFNASLGIAASRVFDPATVVWMAAFFALETVDLEVGAPAPPAGSLIATGPATLVSATLQPQNPAEPITLEPGVPYVLVKGSAAEGRFAFDAATLTLPAESLATFTALVEPLTEQADALVERETPLQSLAVPSTAIVANAAGALCAWVVDATDGQGYWPVAVTLAGSRAGVTDVVSGLAPGDQVLANPADVLEDPLCP